MKIFFATTNKGKLREAKEILGVKINPLVLDVDEVQTLDPVECVEKKAEAAFKISKQPLFVEDTALFFEAWNGLPGVFITYFLKTIGPGGLVSLMKNEKNRSAYAQTSVCYYDGKKKVTTVGKIRGKVATKEQGKSGFGWDAIFIPIGYKKSFAEMGSKEKNKISMRKIALQRLKTKLDL